MMRNLVNNYVEKFMHAKQARRRVVSVIVALALVVSCGVYWELREDGVAMANETYCGMEEHLHGDECYEQVLTCGSEESEAEHMHDASCYESMLTCEIPEHTHDITCLTDETADVETAADWESAIPEELTGVWADDVVAIAVSQLGYAESEANFQLSEDGETRQGYTRYGAWYGNEYGDWDAMFASFCLYYAGVPEDEFPEAAGAYAWITELEELESGDETGGLKIYADAEDYMPVTGDIIFIDADEDEEADHVGIVEEIVTAIDDAGEEVVAGIVVIEGDYDDAVCENSYEPEDTMIIGYGILPKEQEDEDVNVEEEILTLVFEGEGYTVTVAYGPEAELPEDVELVVSEYEADSDVYLDRLAEVAMLCELDEGSIENAEGARLFNISLMAADDEEGELIEVELAADVAVTIAFAGNEEAEEYTVIHFSDETEKVDALSSFEDDVRTISFALDGFSDIMVLADSEIMPLASSDGETGFTIFKYDSSESNGYYEGYYVWVPNGTYRVAYDTAQNNIEDGTYFYVKSDCFTPIEGEENWYEADYHGGDVANSSWQQTYKDEGTDATSSHGSAATVVVDGTTVDPSGETDQMGSYVYFKYDDNTFHDEFGVYLIYDENGEAPYRLDGTIDITSSPYTAYEFQEYTFESSDELGALSGAEFVLYGQHGTSYEGYAYFTYDEETGVYTFVDWYTGYGTYSEDTVPNDDDLPEGCTFYITSGSDGNITIFGFPNDWIDFTLHETKAPAGYELMDDVHFELSYDGEIDVSESQDDVNASGDVLSVENDPTEETASAVSIYKYSSGTDSPLDGAQFILSRTVTETDEETGETTTRTEYAVFVESDGSYTIDHWVTDPGMASHLTSGEDGYIKIGSLHTGTYTLTETTPPEGYVLPENPNTTLVVGESDVKLSIDNDAGDNLEIFKYAEDGEEQAGLEGAEFVLSRAVTKTETDEDTGEETTTTDTEYAVLSDGVLTWVNEKSGASGLASDSNGKIEIPYPGAGEYTLTEVKAPDGYMLLESEVSFTIDQSGNITMSDESNSGASVEEDGTIAIENVAGSTLPNTGGMGRWMFTLLGLLIAGGAAGLLYRNRKRGVIR